MGWEQQARADIKNLQQRVSELEKKAEKKPATTNKKKAGRPASNKSGK